MIKVKEFLQDVEYVKSEHLIENPEISIILPTYCRGDNGLLERAIRTVMAQTFKNWELIIMDDGSKDMTRRVVKKLIKEDARIIYVRNNVNSGLPALRVNQGITLARGKYIAYQFDDDQWYENALEDLYEAIQAFDEPALVYGKCRFLDLLNKNEMIFGDEFDYNTLQVTNIIANNTVLHHKEIPYLYGGYDCHVTLKRLCDWDLWRRWAEYIPIKHVDKVVSLVEGNQEDSLGRTCVLDQIILSYCQNKNRCQSLSLHHIEEYEVDNLDIVPNLEQQKMLYMEHVLPWYKIKLDFVKRRYDEQLNRPKENVLIVMVDFNASVEITVNNYKKLLGDRYNFNYIAMSQLDHRSLYYADIVLVERIIYYNEHIMTLLKEVPSVYMLDDNLLKTHTLGREELSYLCEGSSFYNTMIEYIRKSSMVYCATEAIQKEIFKYNEWTEILPTNILRKQLKGSFNIPQDKIKMVWLGTESRKEEFEHYKEDLLKIQSELKDKVELCIVGWKEEDLKEQGFENVTLIQRVKHYEDYLSKLKKEQIQFIISPILENEFKNAKSPIKYLEATAIGALGIYSNSTVYETVQDGKNGFLLAGDEESLFEKVKQIMTMPIESLEAIYQKAYEDVDYVWTTEGMATQFITMLEKAKLHYYSNDETMKLGWIYNKEITEEQDYYINWLEVIGVCVKKIEVGELGDYSVVNNLPLKMAQDEKIELIVDSTNDPVIQYCVYQGQISYIAYNMLETHWALEEAFDKRTRFNEMLHWISFALKYFKHLNKNR